MTALRLSSLLVLSVLSGCVLAPQPLRGEFAAVLPQDAGATPQRVRWGGRVVDVLPGAEQTCLEVLGLPLDIEARPRELDGDIGRFRACKAGFLDPAVFISGREVTVVGDIEREIERQIGDYSYRMPQLRVETLFLWPERIPFERHFHSGAFFGPGPWWPAPVIIYPLPRTRHHH